MYEDDKELLPFKKPERKIAQSRSKEILGYKEEPSLIKKEKKEHQKTYSKVTDALESAKRLNFYRKLIAEEVMKENGNPNIVTTAEPVVHGGFEKNTIAVTEAQREIEEAKTLKNLGMKVLSLPTDSLRDLRSVFKANINMYRDRGEFIDLVGTSNKKRSIKTVLLRNFLPFMYSENIVIGNNSDVHLVDTGIFDKNAQKSRKNFILTRIQLIGSLISIGIINREIKKGK